jgi:hypothetical protein
MKPVPNLEVDMKKPRQFFTGLAIFGIVSGFLLFFGFVLLIGLQSQKYTNPNENPFLSSRSSLSQHTPVDSLSTTSLFPVTPSPLPVKHILMTATYSDTASGFTIQPPEGWVSSGGVTDGTIFTNKNLGDQAYISIRKKSDIPAAAFLLPTRNIMDSVAQSFNRLPNFNQAKYSLFSSGLNTLYSIEGSMNENHVQYYFLMTKQEIYLITVQSASKDWSSISQSIYDSVGTLTLTNK